MSNARAVNGFKAISLTNQVLWGEMPEDRKEQMVALAKEAGSPEDFISNLMEAGDMLLRALALAMNEPEEAVIAAFEEQLS